MNPELEARNNQESFPNAEQGYVEVSPELPEQIAEQTKEDLYELPNELRTAFDRVIPGLGAEVFSRAQEVSGDLIRQLDDSQQRKSANEYGAFNDNTAVSSERESINFGEINRMVIVMKLCIELLEDQVRRQHTEAKVIDFGQVDGDESRAIPEFWYILTGEREFGAGHEIQVGEYTISSVQDQDADGPGSESRKLTIRKTEPTSELAGSVVAAEEEAGDQATATQEVQDNVLHADFVTQKPEPRYEKQSTDNPGEQSRAA